MTDTKKRTWLELIDRLTKETTTPVEVAGRRTTVAHEALLVQLRAAVFGGMEGTGGSSAFGSKPPIDAAAADLLQEIEKQAAEALAEVDPHPTPLGTAERYVRLWAAQTTERRIFTVRTRAPIPSQMDPLTVDPSKPSFFDELSEVSAIDLLTGWVDRVEDFFDPPKVREIKAPCPACDVETVYRRVDGEWKQAAALNFVRDRVSGETVAAKCSNCRAEWSPDQFEWLARAIGASMLVRDVLEQFDNGDETGWEAEFEFLRKKHAKRIDALAADVQANGMTTPILLGHDGRVWNGHHRLCVAVMLGLESVPVKLVPAPKTADTVTKEDASA